MSGESWKIDISIEVWERLLGRLLVECQIVITRTRSHCTKNEVFH